MTQEHKDLLLKDLCARLPYGVKVMIDKTYLTEDMIKGGYDKIQELYGITCEGNVELLNMDYHMPVESIKPYFLPPSSLPEKQREEYVALHQGVIYNNQGSLNLDIMNYLDWCYKHHVDINCFIILGLAKDATKLNIY